MSRPFKLFRLQQLDSQLDAHQARLAQIEAELSADQELKQAEAQVAADEAGLKAARQALRRAEDEVSQQRLKIELTEAALYGGKVHNPKELQDLQNESASLKRYLVVLEDRQLEAMETEEQAETRLQAAERHLQEVRSASAQRNATLLAEREKLGKESVQLEVERKATVAAVESADLKLYTELRSKRRGVAVAKVVERACAACGSVLSTSLLSVAHSPNQITRCETCGRILYVG